MPDGPCPAEQMEFLKLEDLSLQAYGARLPMEAGAGFIRIVFPRTL
jgi:hypothetical protein